MTRTSRRQILLGAMALATQLRPGSGLLAGQMGVHRWVEPQEGFLSPEIERSIRAGLEFLASRQLEDGAFGTSGYRRNVAVVSLAGMAFMANGSTPGRGPYGTEVTRCVRYILKSCQENGFITVPDAQSHGPMYGHGFATLFLAEVYGMWPDSSIRDKLSAAVKLIVSTQNAEGGWRYQPERRDADISVTICQVMALRAARNAGIFVPNETIDRCIEYVKACQNTDGGFSYMINSRQSLFPRSAAGIVALYSAGIYEGEEIERGLDYLMQFEPRVEMLSHEANYMYGLYYGVQAMWHSGDERFRKWYAPISDSLMAEQRPDGSWFDDICPEYGTAMACIVLQMPSNYLPIFQR